MLDMCEAREIVASYAPPFGQVQLAMRRAYGVTSSVVARRRRRCHRRRGPRRRDVNECMRQRHGADMDV